MVFPGDRGAELDAPCSQRVDEFLPDGDWIGLFRAADFFTPDLVFINSPVQLSQDLLGAVVFMYWAGIIVIVWKWMHVVRFKLDILFIMNLGNRAWRKTVVVSMVSITGKHTNQVYSD